MCCFTQGCFWKKQCDSGFRRLNHFQCTRETNCLKGSCEGFLKKRFLDQNKHGPFVSLFYTSPFSYAVCFQERGTTAGLLIISLFLPAAAPSLGSGSSICPWKRLQLQKWFCWCSEVNRNLVLRHEGRSHLTLRPSSGSYLGCWNGGGPPVASSSVPWSMFISTFSQPTDIWR